MRKVTTLYNKGDFEKAYLALQDLIKHRPEVLDIGDTYLMWANLELLINDEVSEAQALLDKANTLGCETVWYYHRLRGDILLKKGDFHGAIHEYERSIAAEPVANTLKMLGQVLSIGDDDRATSVLERVLKQDPKSCVAYIFLANEALKGGDLQKAQDMIVKAERFSSRVDEIFEIGRVYHGLEQFEKTLKFYLEADKLGYEDKPLLYGSIAACCLSLGRHEAAVDYARRAIEHDPENAYAKEALARSLSAMGDDRALAAWETIVRDQPESCSAHIQLAREAVKRNNLARARELAAKAERLKPSAENAYEIGWIYQHLERYDQALRFYFEAEKLNLGDKALLYGAISSCYVSLGQKDAAVEYVNRVLEIDPEDEFAKELLQACEEMTERSSDN